MEKYKHIQSFPALRLLTVVVVVVIVVFVTLTDRASTIPRKYTYVVANPVRGHKEVSQGQRVTSWRQPATQTNRDPNRDKKLCDSTSDDTDQ